MIITVYTTDDPAIAPNRRCLAQFEKLKNRLCINFYGATPEEARGKAQTFWETEVLPKARPAAERGPDEPAEADDADEGDAPILSLARKKPQVVDDDLLGDLM